MLPATLSLKLKIEIKHVIFIDLSDSRNTLHSSVMAIQMRKKKLTSCQY